MGGAGGSVGQRKFLQITLVALAILLLMRQLWWTLFGYFNVDEFEHLHVIWLFEHGIMPYRDFHHTHLPYYNLILYPLYSLVGPVAELPGLVRIFLFPIILLTIWQIGWIARKIVSHNIAGWIAINLFLLSPIMGVCLSEMRPDSFAWPLSLGAVMLFLDYAGERKDRPYKCYASGLILGVSLLFAQKGILLVLLLALCFERYHFHVLHLTLAERMRRLLGFSAFLIAPIGFTLFGLLAIRLIDFENLLIVLTSGMHYMITDLRFGAKAQIQKSFFLSNLIVIGIGLIGAFGTGFWRGEKLDPKGAGIVLSGAFTIIGLLQMLIIPVLYFHLFVLPFIFISIVAAWWLIKKSEFVILIVMILAGLSSNLMVPSYLDPYFDREHQEAKFRFILDAVPEEEAVLDSYGGFCAFRPIVGKFLFYRPGLFRDKYYREQHEEVAKGLEKRKYGAVVNSPFIKYAPKYIIGIIEKHYFATEEYPEVLLPLPRENES